MLADNIVRTLAIVREMANGKVLYLSDGYRVGMREDMAIGYLATLNGVDMISDMSTMDLAAFNKLLTKHDIGFPIPDSL